MMDINMILLQYFIIFLIKKASATRALSETLARRNKFAGIFVKKENISKKELAKELYKPIIRKVY